jgi:hypothetical protein
MYIKMCPIVKEGIICPVLSASVLKWFIRYVYYCHRWPWPILSFQFRHFDCIASKQFKIIWLSYHSNLSVANKGYYRNASRALNLISTFLFIITHMSPGLYWLMKMFGDYSCLICCFFKESKMILFYRF